MTTLLSLWRPGNFDCHSAVKKILMYDGEQDTSERACRSWATALIRRVIPRFKPGQTLGPWQCIKVGAEFERQRRAAWRRYKRRLRRGITQ